MADDPAAWNEQIKKGLENGITYCQAVRACRVGPIAVNRVSGTQYAFKSLATHAAREPSTSRATSQVEDIERLLARLVAGSRRSRTSDLVAAIEFFTRNAAGEGC